MRAFLLCLTLLALPACGGPPDDAPHLEAGPAAADTVIASYEEALSLAQRMDEGLPFGAARVERMPAADAQEDRVLRLWTQAGQPVKLMATEPDRAGRMTQHSSFYFRNGTLFFVHDPHARYVFDGDQMVTWLDQDLDPVAVSDAQRVGREIEVRERVARYLAAFDR